MRKANAIILLVISSVALLGSPTTPPAAVSIGGLFAPFKKDGSVDQIAIEAQAAFLMAIRDINDKTDGFLDDLLPNTHLRFAIRGSAESFQNIVAANDLLSSVSIGGDIGVHALINGLTASTGDVSVMIDNTAKHYSALHVHAISDSFPKYVDGIEMNPVQKFEITAMTDLLCHYFNYHRVGLISSANDYGVAAAQDLFENNPCDIDIALDLSITPDHVRSRLESVAVKDIRVFLMFFDEAALAGQVLETGYDIGLFRDGTQIFLCDEAQVPALWQQGMSPTADVSRILKGVMGVQYWPTYYFDKTGEAQSFLQRWASQPSTTGSSGSCNHSKDDSGSRFLYQNHAGSVCAGLDFSTYTSIDDIDGVVASVYDAVIVAAMSLHEWLVADSNSLSSASWSDLLTAAVSGVESWPNLIGECLLP